VNANWMRDNSTASGLIGISPEARHDGVGGETLFDLFCRYLPMPSEVIADALAPNRPVT
jgi:hypothetical protein